MSDTDVRIAFLKVERAIRSLPDVEKRRVIRAVAILLDYPEAVNDRANG